MRTSDDRILADNELLRHDLRIGINSYLDQVGSVNND